MLLLCLILTGSVSESFCQTQVLNANSWQSFSSAGTTNGAATDGTFLLYSSFGQPAAISSAALAQTQAGILSSFAIPASVPDKIPPVILPVTPLASSFVQSQTVFQLNVTDDIAVGNVYLHFKPLSASPVFDSVALSSPSLPVNAKAYSFNVSNTAWFDAMGIEYYFTAYDTKLNRARNPVSGNYYSQLITNALTLSSLPVGTSYKIVSFPYDSLSQPWHVASVYKPTKDKSFGRISHYDPATKTNLEYADGQFSSVARGLGYWLLYANPPAISITQVTAPPENRNNLFKITLKANSWNQIGNPYPVTISWNDVLALDDNKNVNANLLSKLNLYNGGTYDSAGNSLLQPFAGGFVKNFSPTDITLLIPFQGQSMQGSRISAFGNDLSQDAWNIFLHVSESSSEVENLIGGFGMHPHALIGTDRYDNYNPPSLVSVPELNFHHDAFPDIDFGNDIVPTAESFHWSFTPVAEEGKNVNLVWNSSLVATGQQLFLVDENTLTITDMTTSSAYRFTQSAKSTFSIYFGKDALKQIVPSQLRLEGPYPNPVAADRSFSFSVAVPDNNSDTRVNIWFYNGVGELIGNQESVFGTGIHELRYNFNNSQPSGIYFYKSVVQQGNSLKKTAGKIIVP